MLKNVQAVKKAYPDLDILFNVVVTDENIREVNAMVNRMNGIGASFVNFNGMLLPDHIAPSVGRHGLTHISNKERNEYLDLFNEVESKSKKLDIDVNISGFLKGRVARSGSNGVGMMDTSLPSGHTRLCIQPWKYAGIFNDGYTRVCCDAPVGYLETAENVFEDSSAGVNSPFYRRVRKGLLTGDLLPMCRYCASEKSAPLEEAKKWYAKSHGITDYLV